MSNLYLQALVSSGPFSSAVRRSPGRTAFGFVPLVVAGATAGTVALTAGAAGILSKFYNVEGSLRLDSVIEQVNEANSAFPAIPPVKEGPAWFSVAGRREYANARRAPASVGDANAKALFWMALASRAMGSRGLAKIALDGVQGFDANMYSDSNPSEIRNVLMKARDIIIKNAGVDQADSIRGIPETLNEMSKIDSIKSNQSLRLSPVQSVQDLVTQAPSNLEKAAEGLVDAGREAGCQGKKTFLPDFMLNEKCEIRTWVIPAGLATVTVLAGVLVFAAGRRQRDLMLALGGRDRLDDRSSSRPAPR